MSLDFMIQNILLFFPLFARSFAFIRFAPLLNDSGIIPLVRVALALSISFLLFPKFSQNYQSEYTLWAYIGLIVIEVLLGLTQAFLLQLMYTVFLLTVQFFSVQMGLGIAEAFSSLTQSTASPVGEFITISAFFLFSSSPLFLNFFYVGLYESFDNVNTGSLLLYSQESFYHLLIKGLADLFEKSYNIALPMLGTLLMLTLTLGLLAKAAPQINLLILSMPISFLVGLVMLYLAYPSILKAFSFIIELMFSYLKEFYRLAL